MHKRTPYLAVEMFLLCAVLPTYIIVFKKAVFMLPFLWGTALVCWLIYRRSHHEQLKTIWKWRAVNGKNLTPILVRWIICSALIVAFTYFYDPAKMFNIILKNPSFVPKLMIFYPIFSALPQEFIFCTFFFDRYAPFFQTDRAKIIASAIVFAYAHVLYINPIAPALSLIGGLIFAATYAKTKSLALVTIEHGLYGNVLFLSGLGWYFWSGALANAH